MNEEKEEREGRREERVNSKLAKVGLGVTS
jgi:hypothetical protein